MRVRAFTVLEVLISMGIFAVLGVLLLASLRQTTGLWRRSAGRDEALRQLTLAKQSLTRDLLNSSRQVGQFASASVTPSLGAGKDGDCLSFLSSDSGQSDENWQVNPASGQANVASQITYYCIIPNGPNPDDIAMVPGPPDANGYEQQFPGKWLMRRIDPPPGTTPPVLDPAWSSWVVRPTTATSNASVQVAAKKLLNFRVLRTAPLWSIELRATALLDARHSLNLGSVPLATSPYTITQQFTVPARN